MSDRNIRIYEAAERGNTTAKIAKRFGISETQVRRITAQARGPAKARALVISRLRKAWAMKLVRKGFNMTEASAVVGCARSTLFG